MQTAQQINSEIDQQRHAAADNSSNVSKLTPSKSAETAQALITRYLEELEDIGYREATIKDDKKALRLDAKANSISWQGLNDARKFSKIKTSKREQYAQTRRDTLKVLGLDDQLPLFN